MKVLLILLLVLLLLLLLPVGVWVIFSGEGLRLFAEVGPLKIKILPRKAPEPEKDKQKKKTEKQKKDTENTKQDKTPEEKASLGAQLPFFRELLGKGLSALGFLKRKLILRKLTVYLSVGCKGEDPAQTGILYGRAWAAVGGLTPLLENSFRIRKRDIQVFCNFLEDKTTVYAEGRIMLHVGDILHMGFRYGVPMLILMIKNKRKGGTSNGTSDK